VGEEDAFDHGLEGAFFFLAEARREYQWKPAVKRGRHR
jgi:hypothetical protein